MSSLYQLFIITASECVVSEWSAWSSCILDQGSCDTGIQTRERSIIRKQGQGGEECPLLIEKMSCFKECFQPRGRHQPGVFHFDKKTSKAGNLCFTVVLQLMKQIIQNYSSTGQERHCFQDVNFGGIYKKDIPICRNDRPSNFLEQLRKDST